MAPRLFSQGSVWLSFLLVPPPNRQEFPRLELATLLLSTVVSSFWVLLLFLQPGQYGKETHRRKTTTLQPNATATTVSTGCSTIKETLVLKLSGTKMPGCNDTDQIPDGIQNCSSPSNCSIPSDTSPARVNNLTVIGRTNHSVTLVWESPPCPSSPCGMDSAGSWNGTGHFSDLQPGRNYTAVMYRVTEAGRCNQSVPVHVTTSPSPVWNITVQDRTVDSLKMAWMSPEDSSVSRYTVCLSDATLQLSCSSAPIDSYTAGSLAAGVLYTVTVYAVTSNNVSSTGTVVQGVTLPNEPGNITVTKNGTHNLTISWDPPNDLNAAAYLYRVFWVRENTEDQKESGSTNTSSYTISGLVPGSVYVVELVSVIEDAESAGAKNWTLTNPSPPTDFRVNTINQSAVHLSWKPPDSAFSGFKIELWTGPTETPENHTFSNETSFVWNALSPGSKYNFTLSTMAEGRGLRRFSTGILREGATDIPHQVACCASPTVIAGALFAVLLLLVLLSLLLFYFRRRRETVVEKPKANAGPPCVLASVSVSAFPCYCCEHFSDSAFGFAKEYQQLQDTEAGLPHAVAELPENRDKNRYSNVLPYDNSRVKLHPSPSDPNSDYINASYIPGYHGEKVYIATQGPLPGTVHDFWRMIWEQRVTTLVMLTNCVENGRVKCERYWPLDYTPCTYGDFTVSVVIETILPDWTIRDFSIKQKNECAVRCARHYHYTSWPDHGVPSMTSTILLFRDLVRKHVEQQAESGPALVHCSAGVGRTGTFIALDTLLIQAQKEGRIGVYSFVQRMRMNRPLMIQTEMQYVFLHQCLLDRIQPPPPDTSEKTQSAAVYENTLAFQDYEVSRV